MSDVEPATSPSLPGGAILALRRRRLDLRRHVGVMGIVNATPDSFYDQGQTFAVEEAVQRARALVSEGAEIIDIGGIKGGPGPEVAVDEEIARVVPVIEALRRHDETTIVSVDTWRAPVAERVLEVGADIINDVTGGTDDELLGVVGRQGAGYVAMHHGGEPRTRPYRRAYDPDVTTAVLRHLRNLVRRAQDAGVSPDRIVVDPGHDFQKTTAHSLELTRRLGELHVLGHPVLVALSNKDFVGETLGADLEGRVEGSIAAAVYAILQGARIVRVHEVARTVAAVEMTETLLGWRPPSHAVRGLE
ncbi:MAG: dihydropteroate synthase [Nitriliruptorales bacterium]|nr:dihydropteroate synthase [Nitriliruptorales bacterium]